MSSYSFKIQRFNPDKDTRPHYESYSVELDQTDRVLDGLNEIKWTQDGTLTYRRSCAHGVCGSDAMRINGRNRLACKVLIKEVGGSNITIEPMLGFKIIKDLVVDLEPFFEKYRSIAPYLINETQPGETERLQSPEDRAKYDDGTKCILCAACTTSCPPFWANKEFVGPAAIVNAHRFIFDSRDEGADERLAVLNNKNGVWRCRTVFNCTDACPRDIEITRAIEDVKRTLLFGKL
ncbi:MAG TPA: succinate dehydrogenase iron-sulfur subunit [Chloroflexota bacterium]|jgi:succinate dehydrogenase / fumarate reductase iron-sulfur subunit